MRSMCSMCNAPAEVLAPGNLALRAVIAVAAIAGVELLTGDHELGRA